jgi:hypothetical protein
LAPLAFGDADFTARGSEFRVLRKGSAKRFGQAQAATGLGTASGRQ